jgi:hypothetical protein
MFFYLKIFFSDVPVQVPEHIWKQLEPPFRKLWGQNIRRKDANPYPNPKKISGSESEKNYNTAKKFKKLCTGTGNWYSILMV